MIAVYPPNVKTCFHPSRVKVFQKMVALKLLLSSGVDCTFLHDVCHVSDVLVPSFSDDGLDCHVDDHHRTGEMVFVGRRRFIRGIVKFGVHCISMHKA